MINLTLLVEIDLEDKEIKHMFKMILHWLEVYHLEWFKS